MKKLNARNLTEKEVILIAEFLTDEYNEAFGDANNDSISLAESLETVNGASLLQAFDTKDSTYIVMVTFDDIADEDNLTDKTLDEFIIKDGVVESANNFDLV